SGLPSSSRFQSVTPTLNLTPLSPAPARRVGDQRRVPAAAPPNRRRLSRRVRVMGPPLNDDEEAYNPAMTTHTLSRRAALKTIGAGAGALAFLPLLSEEGLAAFAEAQKAGVAPPVLKVLTPAQYATVEALVEAIIPTDERSPGAKQARVADYIDLLLSEAE